tara:strand:+ start:5542 stop:7653 length:2112 start_codon:yes stop_codon:yes gene_type:complete
MVKSKIHPTKINYNENKQLDKEDVKHCSSRYETSNFTVPIEIALGKEKHTYSAHNIIYFSVYLIVDNMIKDRIGIVEIDSNRFIDSLDEDGDFILDNGNLIFFVDDDYIIGMMKDVTLSEITDSDESSSEDEDSSDEEDLEPIQIKDDVLLGDVETLDNYDTEDVLAVDIPEEKRSNVTEKTEKELENGLFEIMDPLPSIETLTEENKEMSEQIKRDYKPSSKQLWIQKYMKNTNYNIIDNEGSGDCFFAVIRDAYQHIGKKTTVEKLRALLSSEANEEIFKQYRMLYNGFNSQYEEMEDEMKKLKKSAQILKSRSKSSITREQSKDLLDEANKVIDQYKQKSEDKKEIKQLMEEFEYMKDINTLDEFKDFIKTRHYWADTWAVSTLERLLNVKVIIMSEAAYTDGDLDSVLSCGQLNDDKLEKQGGFKPDYYIIAAYSGSHYTLIDYKEKRILKFSEVPYDIKALIINKCMERNAGPYYMIQDMRNFKTKIGLDANEGKPVDDEDDYNNMDLYDKDVLFMYYNNSSSKPYPGKGSGEKIQEVNIMDFNKLHKLKNWRKKLDDSWIAPFTLDGHRWNSVEHYYLGSQFKKGFPDFYLKFSLDSDTEISKDLSLARIAGGKTGKTKDNVLREKKIVIDSDFYEVGVNPRHREERFNAIDAKFKQNLDLQQILKETKRAKLTHFIRGREPEIDILLMKIRREISQ